jgi:hypothetical protein
MLENPSMPTSLVPAPAPPDDTHKQSRLAQETRTKRAQWREAGSVRSRVSGQKGAGGAGDAATAAGTGGRSKRASCARRSASPLLRSLRQNWMCLPCGTFSYRVRYPPVRPTPHPHRAAHLAQPRGAVCAVCVCGVCGVCVRFDERDGPSLDSESTSISLTFRATKTEGGLGLVSLEEGTRGSTPTKNCPLKNRDLSRQGEHRHTRHAPHDTQRHTTNVGRQDCEVRLRAL